MAYTLRKRALTRDVWARIADDARLETGGRRYLVRRSTHTTDFGVTEWLQVLCEVELVPATPPPTPVSVVDLLHPRAALQDRPAAPAPAHVARGEGAPDVLVDRPAELV